MVGKLEEFLGKVHNLPCVREVYGDRKDPPTFIIVDVEDGTPDKQVFKIYLWDEMLLQKLPNPPEVRVYEQPMLCFRGLRKL